MFPIAIIDDGINARLFDLPTPVANIEISESMEIDERVDCDALQNSHGTMCAAVIQRFAPAAQFISIRITDRDTEKSTTPRLIRALEWCKQNGVRLLNLSMGTVDYRDFANVGRAVRELAGTGCILVCAYNNMNIYTCPASLPCVLGVKSDRSGLLKIREYCFEADSTGKNGSVELANNIVIGSEIALTDIFGISHPTGKANSFAAPLMTAKVYQMLTEAPDLFFGQVVARLKTQPECLPCDKGVAKISYPDSDNENATPVIAIIEDGDVLSNSFVKQFKSDGYNALHFTGNNAVTQDTGVIPQKFYSGDRTISKNVLSLLNRIYTPDVMIFSLQSTEQIEQQNLADFILTPTEIGIHLYNTESKSAEIFCSVEKAYHHMIAEYNANEPMQEEEDL